MKYWLAGALFLVFAGMFPAMGKNQCFPEKDTVLVYDMSGLLSDAQRVSLDRRLKQFEKSTSNQVVLVITGDICGMDIGQFGTELIENWGIGQAREDNGLAIVLKPKTTESRGEVNISTGRGLEGILPDSQCWLIEQNEMIPSFKENDYYGGIVKALDVITSLAAQEYTIADYAKAHGKKDNKGNWSILLLILVVLILFIVRLTRARRYARVNGLDWWTAWMLLNQASRKHKGYWGDFSGGRGGFGGWSGGGGGGGFGGFGGGSSGGGGASSSW